MLVHIGCADIAQATGDHDRLVITTQLFTLRRVDFLFVSAKISGNPGTAEFIVKRTRTERRFQHDLQRRSDVPGLAIIYFPGLFGVGNAQIRH